MKGLLICAFTLAITGPAAAQSGKPGGEEASPGAAAQLRESPFRETPAGYKLVHRDNLHGPDPLRSFWATRPDEWRFVEGDLDDGAGNVVKGVGPALFFKSSRTYKSRVRAPQSIALVKHLKVGGNFVLEVEMMQTGVETAHRDLCLFFGFQGPERFFYNHLGKVPDPHSSNVFNVERADRIRIGDVSKQEINWGRGVWHQVRLECEWHDAQGGRVRTYFDDMETPLFDKPLFREAAGLVGLGSFDDAGAFRNLRVWAKDSTKATGDLSPFGDEITVKLSSVGPRSGGLKISGAGSAKVGILGEEYRVGMVQTRDGKVLTRESMGRGFYFDDGLDWTFETDEGAREAAKAAYLREFSWVMSNPGALEAAPGLVGLDEAVVLECGVAVTAMPESIPDYSSDASMEPIYAVKLRIEPAKESRSSYLAKRYRSAAGGQRAGDPEGIWRWTTDLTDALSSGADRRPILLAITPAGDPFSVHLDTVIEADEETLRVLSKRYRCIRMDPTVIAGDGLRWPAKCRVELGKSVTCFSTDSPMREYKVKLDGDAMCLVMDARPQYSPVQKKLSPAEFLAGLEGR